MANLLDALVESADFAAIRQRVLCNAPLPSDRFPGRPDNAISQWTASQLGAVQTQGAALSWKTLLRQLFGAPLFVGAHRTAVPIAPNAVAPTTADDVEQAHRLILGRRSTQDAGGELIGTDLAALVTALVLSDEFQGGLVNPLFAGDVEPDGRIVPMGVLRWLRTRFGIDASVHASRFSLIGAVLQTDFVAAPLSAAAVDLDCPPAALAKQLMQWSKPANGEPAFTPLEYLQGIGRGIEILQTQNLSLRDGGRFCMEGGDPALVFSLDPETFNEAAAVELNFAVADARQRAKGVLYIDYGAGYSEHVQVELTPRGRRRYGAALLTPSRIKTVRWDPDNANGELSIAFISARPLGEGQLHEMLAEVEACGIAVDFSTDPQSDAKLCSVSRLLTRYVYGHEGAERGDYASWIEEHEASSVDGARLWAERLSALRARPLISVLVPTYETPSKLLRAMIESVQAQVYPHWELCIADDASKSPHVQEIIEAYMAEDPRIKAVFRPVNGHISEASNSALALAAGDWLALLDHDDLLTPNALLEVAAEIEAHPDAVFIYSDEDKLDAGGARYEPFFKPDFSPELLRAQNYLNHLSVHRTAAVRAVGGWRKGFEGSQDYDLNLRILERVDPARVRHIPKVLYHWRAVEGSTALAGEEKGYAFTAGLKALEEHVARLQWDAAVEPVGDLPFYRVRHALPSPAPMVSLIIPTRDHADLLATCIDSVLRLTDYPSYEVLIVDNGSVEPQTAALFKRLTKDPRVRLVEQPGPFNYSRINNQAVKESRGEIVALLNNDIEVITPGWMTEMAAWASQPRIGCVGAKLYYPNDTVQHAGVTLGMGGVAGHPHKHRGREDPGYFGRIAISHDVSAVTGACLFVRREIWDALGGLDERLAVAFNDVDFCIRVRDAGYSNVFTPFAELYHHESISRGAEDNPEKQARFQKEVQFMQERWSQRLTLDPFYSPNLSRVREDYSIG